VNAARVRLFVKGLTPPFLWTALKRLKDAARAPRNSSGEPPGSPEPPPLVRSRGQAASRPPERPDPKPEWEYVPEGWARAGDPRVKGWDVDAIVAAYRAKWPSYLRALQGPDPLGVYHEVPEGVEVGREDHSAHNLLVSFAYVLALAARGKERVSMLDWGGGIGHYYPLAQAVLPETGIDYACKDVPKLVAYGRELFPEAAFYEDASCLERRYDLILVSGSLQYSEKWEETLSRLAAATAGYLYVTRLPVAFEAPSFVVLQRAYAYGYDTEYLGWVISRRELLDEARRAGLELVREFLLDARFSADGAPESPVDHRGFLFRPR
jgi:putative methyltransferase (TIGR04325 family)